MEDYPDARFNEISRKGNTRDRLLIRTPSPRHPAVQNHAPYIRVARRHRLHAHQVARLQDAVAVHLQGGAEGGADFLAIIHYEHGFHFRNCSGWVQLPQWDKRPLTVIVPFSFPLAFRPLKTTPISVTMVNCSPMGSPRNIGKLSSPSPSTGIHLPSGVLTKSIGSPQALQGVIAASYFTLFACCPQYRPSGPLPGLREH